MLFFILAFFLWRVIVTKTAQRLESELNAREQEFKDSQGLLEACKRDGQRAAAEKDKQIDALAAELAEVNAILDAHGAPVQPPPDAGVVLPPVVIPAP